MSDEKKFIEDPVVKQNFAREQYEWLKEQGITNRLRLSRIFKAAGPGQIKEAWKLATCFDWEEDPVSRDLLDCLLAGAKIIKFGRRRMEAVLKDCNMYVPTAHNTKCFFRVLAGAREILVPKSHRFSKKEMEEIADGLRKQIENDKEDDSEEGDKNDGS